MSVPEANKPTDSLATSAVKSATNALNYISETVAGTTAEAKKEAGIEQAKGNVPGETSALDRLGGGADALSGKLDETKHKNAAELNKDSI